MTDPQTSPAAKTESPAISQLLVDLGPVAVFVVVYNILNRSRPDDAIFIATGVFIAATLAAIAWCKWKRGKVPPVLIVTGVLVTAFGGLSILLHDENFMKIKPTVVYLFYVAAIVGSMLMGHNIWKLLFHHAFSLPDRIWRILAWRWAGLFLFLAALNEYIRLNYSTDVWVNTRITVFFPAVLVFGLLNTPLVLKHTATEPEAPAAPGDKPAE